jgi:tetratricopeptide (TPR) repeat protein
MMLRITTLNQRIALDPNDANAYCDRGTYNLQLQNHQAAMADLARAIAINPEYAIAYYHRSIVKFDLFDGSGAIADLDRAISLQEGSANEIDPKYAIAYYWRGCIKWDLNDRQGSISDLVEAAELYARQDNISRSDRIMNYVDELRAVVVPHDRCDSDKYRKRRLV